MTVRRRVSGPRHWTITDPALIRAVLDRGEQVGLPQAAREHGCDASQTYEWRKWRRRLGDWPNDQDIAEWQAWERSKAERRKVVRQSRKRRILLGELTVDPTGTQRRLQALFALGWGGEDIGARLGLNRTRVNSLMRGTRIQRGVYRSTAVRVARVYDELSMIRPEGPKHDRLRRWAARLGYVPPLAWDDDEIDDPRARPHTGPIRVDLGYDEAVVDRLVSEGVRLRTLTHTEAAEAVRRLKARGLTGGEIERRYGLKPERYHLEGRAS